MHVLCMNVALFARPLKTSKNSKFAQFRPETQTPPQAAAMSVPLQTSEPAIWSGGMRASV